MLNGITSELSTEIIFVTFINNGGVSRSPHLSCEGHLVGGLVEFSLAVVFVQMARAPLVKVRTFPSAAVMARSVWWNHGDQTYAVA